jgi:hypothetical protein
MTRLKWEWPLVALLGAAYIVVCVSVEAILYCDYADHLARAYVAADLMFRGGEHFGAIFRFEPMPVAYVLGDLILAVAVHWFGTSGATVFWTILNLLALPLAVAFYLHVTKAAAEVRAACVLMALYFAGDSFLIAGFLNFHLAVAMVVFSLGVAQQLRARFSAGVYAAYLLMLASGFLMHLSFVLYGGAAIGVTALWRLWRRETTFAREAALLAPFGVLAAWHLASSFLYPADPKGVGPAWGSLSSKLRRLNWELVRLHERLDVLAALVVAGCAAGIAALRMRARASADPVAWELLLLGVAFVAVFLVMPFRVGGTTYLDVRALTLASPFLALGLLVLAIGRGPDLARPGQRALLTLACAGLAALNLLLLYTGLRPWQQWLTNYRALTVSVPAGSNVLPVHTLDRQGQWRLQLHAAPLAVVADRNAIVPNMFGADRGEPMKYFSYVKRGYNPDGLWVLEKLPVDWHAVACGYEFILVTEPFSMSDFGLPTSVVAQNTSGALLRIDATACARFDAEGRLPAGG